MSNPQQQYIIDRSSLIERGYSPREADQAITRINMTNLARNLFIKVFLFCTIVFGLTLVTLAVATVYALIIYDTTNNAECHTNVRIYLIVYFLSVLFFLCKSWIYEIFLFPFHNDTINQLNTTESESRVTPVDNIQSSRNTRLKCISQISRKKIEKIINSIFLLFCFVWPILGASWVFGMTSEEEAHCSRDLIIASKLVIILSIVSWCFALIFPPTLLAIILFSMRSGQLQKLYSQVDMTKIIDSFEKSIHFVEFQCPICLEGYIDTGEVIGKNFEKSNSGILKCYPCGHEFHENCLRNWCKLSSSCPMCRTELEARNNDI